jgi:hypothetical protein
MAVRDSIHEAVKNAMIKDGWTITHDPFSVLYDNVTLFIDLGGERVIAAERDNVKIAVEIRPLSDAPLCMIWNRQSVSTLHILPS